MRLTKKKFRAKFSQHSTVHLIVFFSFKNKFCVFITALTFLFSSISSAYSADYIIKIPDTLTVNNSGLNATDGISADCTANDFETNKKLIITASSSNDFALKLGENSIGYTMNKTSWDFLPAELNQTNGASKDLKITVEDYSNKPAGNYTDTVTFTAAVENNLVSFTVKRVGGSYPDFTDGNYTVAPGTTWQQFIQSGNAPACLSIGTYGVYSGKVCHDMNNSIQDCGGTIIANTADKKRVKSGDAIIGGATYGCSDYLSYQDHD